MRKDFQSSEDGGYSLRSSSSNMQSHIKRQIAIKLDVNHRISKLQDYSFDLCKVQSPPVVHTTKNYMKGMDKSSPLKQSHVHPNTDYKYKQISPSPVQLDSFNQSKINLRQEDFSINDFQLDDQTHSSDLKIAINQLNFIKEAMKHKDQSLNSTIYNTKVQSYNNDSNQNTPIISSRLYDYRNQSPC